MTIPGNILVFTAERRGWVSEGWGGVAAGLQCRAASAAAEPTMRSAGPTTKTDPVNMSVVVPLRNTVRAETYTKRF